MKKQTKYRIFLLGSIIFLNLFFIKPTIIDDSLLTLTVQDTTRGSEYKNKIMEQSKKIDKIDQKVDSAQLKWDAIEKALKEKQHPK